MKLKKMPKTWGVFLAIPPDRLGNWLDVLSDLDATVKVERKPKPPSIPDALDWAAAYVSRWQRLEILVTADCTSKIGCFICLSIPDVNRNFEFAKEIESAFLREGFLPIRGGLCELAPLQRRG